MRRALGAALCVWAASACRPTAPSGLTLLFYNRSPAAALGGRSWAPDPDHARLLVFDDRLHLVKTLAGAELATPVAVAALGSRLLVSEETGEGVVLDTNGAGVLVRDWPSPFPVALYGAAGTRIVAVRSPYRVPAVTPEPPDAPLVQVLDSLGRPLEGLATIHVPATPFLTQITNAGALAVDSGGAVYYAPLVRDEIVKYDASGVRRWATTRHLRPSETEPVYLPAKGRELQVEEALVNVALALGPDGRLYALGAEDSAATRMRVDVLDTATGAIVATRRLEANETAVAVDATGRLATFDASVLARNAGSGPREAFAPAFALPDTLGDTVTLASFAGKVTLVDFWASWCDPCREEFPHMIALYDRLPRKDFAIAAISDDVERDRMLAFVREYRPPFAVLVGGGRMKQLYHYRGLPYSVLLDRRGRVVERYFGFGGAEEFQRLSAAIANELGGP